MVGAFNNLTYENGPVGIAVETISRLSLILAEQCYGTVNLLFSS